MQDPSHQVIVQRRLEQALVTFFVGCALYVVVVYVAAPSVYTTALMLSAAPTSRYPLPATLLLVTLLAFLTVVLVGVVHHWRWLFWVLLVAFGCSILVIPTTILQLMGRLPDSFPTWYSLSRMGVALLEVGLAVWMVQIYRHHGVGALGREASRHT